MAEKLKIISLGGLDEIGKNMTVYEYGNDIIVVDCGMGFPEDDMYGCLLYTSAARSPDTTKTVKMPLKVEKQPLYRSAGRPQPQTAGLIIPGLFHRPIRGRDLPPHKMPQARPLASFRIITA